MAPSPAAANIGFHLAMDTLPSGNCKRWLQVRLGCVQLSPSCPFRLLHTCLSPGPRGITPAFGYGAPHPSARGTSTLLINALLSAHYGPLRHPLASPRFPGFAGYTVPCSADFATGRGWLLQLLSASLPSCCRCNPAGVDSPLQPVCDDPCCLRSMKKSSTSGIPFRGYVYVDSLRPDDSLTILRCLRR